MENIMYCNKIIPGYWIFLLKLDLGDRSPWVLFHYHLGFVEMMFYAHNEEFLKHWGRDKMADIFKYIFLN